MFISVKNIFCALLVLGLLANAICLIVEPDNAYIDSRAHLGYVKEIIEGSYNFSFWRFPLYYVISAPVFLIFPMEYPFTKIIPALLTIGITLVGFFLFRNLFKDNWVIASAFLANYSWLTRYGSVNYTGQLAAFLFLLFIYFSVTKREILRIDCIFLLFLAKLNAIPLIVASFFVENDKIKEPVKWGLIHCLPFSIIGVWLMRSFANNNLLNPLIVFVSFFDFPPATAFMKFALLWDFNYLACAFIFMLMILPTFYVIVKGFRVEQKCAYYFTVLVSLIALVSFFASVAVTPPSTIDWRYTIPVLPLVAIFFARGFLLLPENKRLLPLISFILYCGFSFVLVVLSSMNYAGII